MSGGPGPVLPWIPNVTACPTPSRTEGSSWHCPHQAQISRANSHRDKLTLWASSSNPGAQGFVPRSPGHFLGLERPLLFGAGGGGAGGPPTPCSPQPCVLGFRGRQEPRTQDPGGT